MKEKTLPHFKSTEEEAKFWETRSVADYLGQLEQVDDIFVLAPGLAKKIKERAKKRMISLRLANWEIQKAKEIARKKRIPYQTLIRQWIDEKIRGELAIQT